MVRSHAGLSNHRMKEATVAKAKKTVRKPAVKPDLLSIAVHANIPWEHAARLTTEQHGMAPGGPEWEITVAREHARLSFLWAEAMVEAGQS